MKLKKFLSDLQDINDRLKQQKLEVPYIEYLGFYPEIMPDDKYSMLSKGYWSSFFFAGYLEGEVIGMRILPEKSYTNWPIHQNNGGMMSYTVSPSLSTFIAFCQADLLMKTYGFIRVSKDWETVMELCKPLLELFGGFQEMHFIKEYASNLENKPESNDPKANLSSYLLFWNRFDTDPGHPVLRDLIEQLQEDIEWLPESIPGNAGHWETRIHHLLMSRAGVEWNVHEQVKVLSFISAGLRQPNGYDQEYSIFSHFPAEVVPKNAISGIISFFDIVEQENLGVFADTYLYRAALRINEDFNGYDGEEHYLAALEFESENKPLDAWNALLNASYWAGANDFPDAVEIHWKKAIELCEKQNWTDAHEALTLQWEWYQKMKLEQ